MKPHEGDPQGFFLHRTCPRDPWFYPPTRVGPQRESFCPVSAGAKKRRLKFRSEAQKSFIL